MQRRPQLQPGESSVAVVQRAKLQNDREIERKTDDNGGRLRMRDLAAFILAALALMISLDGYAEPHMDISMYFPLPPAVRVYANAEYPSMAKGELLPPLSSQMLTVMGKANSSLQ